VKRIFFPVAIIQIDWLGRQVVESWFVGYPFALSSLLLQLRSRLLLFLMAVRVEAALLLLVATLARGLEAAVEQMVQAKRDEKRVVAI
jgi:hypothetical protein